MNYLLDEGLEYIEEMSQLLDDIRHTAENVDNILTSLNKTVIVLGKQIQKIPERKITCKRCSQNYLTGMWDRNIFEIVENGTVIGYMKIIDRHHTYQAQIKIGNKAYDTYVCQSFEELVPVLIEAFDRVFAIDFKSAFYGVYHDDNVQSTMRLL